LARSRLVIRQGEVWWVVFGEARGSEPAGRRPALVVQHDRFNRTALNTVAVLAITSNLRFAELPGNVRLRKGDANLEKPSVVNVTQIHALDRRFLVERVGSLSPAQMRRVWEGLQLLLEVAR
jgi:mRNA interferase MazF